MRRLLQQPPEFRPIETVAAHDRAVQQQYRYVEAVAALELGVCIDVERFERWQRDAAAENPEVGEHLLAQRTVAPVHESQTCRSHALPARGGSISGGYPGRPDSAPPGARAPSPASRWTARWPVAPPPPRLSCARRPRWRKPKRSRRRPPEQRGTDLPGSAAPRRTPRPRQRRR